MTTFDPSAPRAPLIGGCESLGELEHAWKVAQARVDDIWNEGECADAEIQRSLEAVRRVLIAGVV